MSLSASASSNDGLQQTGYYTDYDSDGDFTYSGDGKQKHLVFYKQVSAYSGSFPWETVAEVTGFFVNNYGQRCSYRVIGYNNGNEVFRSGLAPYGTPVNIRGASFTYFDVWVVNEDENGDLVPVQTLLTSKLQFSYDYYVPFPTEEQEPTYNAGSFNPYEPVPEDIDYFEPETTPDIGGMLSDSELDDDTIYCIGDTVTMLVDNLAGYLLPIAALTFIGFAIYGKEW